MTVDTPLERALSIARNGDPANTLHGLLAAWQHLPCPALASAIRSLSLRTAHPVPASLRGRGTPALNSWLALARQGNELDTPALLETLLKASPADTIPRLQAISDRADPRIDSWCLETIESLPYIPPYTRKYLACHIKRLAEVRDAALLDRILALPARWTREVEVSTSRWLCDILSVHLSEIRTRLSELTEDSPMALALANAVDIDTNRHRIDTDALLAMVYADPQSDGPRLVYADALLERGDPRGEIIALQIMTPESSTARKRAKQLVAEYGRRWLGSLAPALLPGFSFERGFLASARINTRAPRLLDAVVGDPMWSTVTHLSGSARVGLHPSMRALRHLGVDFTTERHLQDPWVELLETTERPLRSLSYRTSHATSAHEIDLLGHCAALPLLTELELAGARQELFAAILKGPVINRLEQLKLVFTHPPFGLGDVVFSAIRNASVPTLALEIKHPLASRFTLSKTAADDGYVHLDAVLSSGPGLEALQEFLILLPNLREVHVQLRRPVDETVSAEIEAILQQRILETYSVKWTRA